MATIVRRRHVIGVHPLHALFLAAMLSLFVGGLVSDLAYSSTYEIQWSNFAAWLIVGGMVFTALALIWALFDLLRPEARGARQIIHALILPAVFVFGLLNSFVHARDAWAVMPQGLILSIIVTLFAGAAAWLGFVGDRQGVPA